MEIYDSLLKAVHDEYDTLRVLKKSARGEVSLVRHRESGTRYIFRHFEGSSEVYQLLLGLSCRNLPQIMGSGRKGRQDGSAGRVCGRATPWEKFWREEC